MKKEYFMKWSHHFSLYLALHPPSPSLLPHSPFPPKLSSLEIGIARYGKLLLWPGRDGIFWRPTN